MCSQRSRTRAVGLRVAMQRGSPSRRPLGDENTVELRCAAYAVPDRATQPASADRTYLPLLAQDLQPFPVLLGGQFSPGVALIEEFPSAIARRRVG